MQEMTFARLAQRPQAQDCADHGSLVSKLSEKDLQDQ